jgi:integrase
VGKSHKLSAVKVARVSKSGRYGDGEGLWLQVTSSGTKSWAFRYMQNGRARQMGLGSADLLSLKEAREHARQARRLLKIDGVDPLEARRQARLNAELEAARALTFQDCAQRYIAAHEAGWRNPTHRAQWKATLATYAYHEIGNLPISAIDTALVMRVLEPIWQQKPETASRLRGRIESILDWAAARSYRQGENPARWRGHLNKLLPSRRKIAAVQHHPAMPYRDVPGFMVRLRQRDGISPRALEFVILTAARTGEAIGAAWPEIDFDERAWTVPAQRMKGRRPHRVPLSKPCIDLLTALPRFRGCDFVFPGTREGRGLSNMALLELMRGMAPAYVPHGFRSSFKDWARETTDHQNGIVEAALAHAIGDKVEAAYTRGDALAKRRALMDDWASYCGGRYG